MIPRRWIVRALALALLAPFLALASCKAKDQASLRITWFDPVERVAIAIEQSGPADMKDSFAPGFDLEREVKTVLRWQLGELEGEFEPEQNVYYARWSPAVQRIVAMSFEAVYLISPGDLSIREVFRVEPGFAMLHPGHATDDEGRWLFAAVDSFDGVVSESSWLAVGLESGRISRQHAHGSPRDIRWTGEQCLMTFGDDLHRISILQDGEAFAQIDPGVMNDRWCNWIDRATGESVFDIVGWTVEWTSTDGRTLQHTGAHTIGVTEEGIWVTVGLPGDDSVRALLDRTTGDVLRREPANDGRSLVRGPRFAHWSETRDGVKRVSSDAWSAAFSLPPGH